MNQSHSVFPVAVVVAVLAGCSAGQTPIAQAPDPVIQQQQEQIASLQDSVSHLSENLSAKEAEAMRSAREAEEAKVRLSQASATGTGLTDLLPPNASAGECYARVFVPPTYKTLSERVMSHDSVVDVTVIPARYEWGEERVLVREASTRLEVIPATYEWKEERVLVRAASTRLEEIPAVYETRQERVVDVPEHTVWKKGRGAIERIDEATGEIMCLVTVPATYKTVTRRVLVQAPTTREVTIPAEYETVRTRVVKTPATTRTVEIPAEYETVRVQKVATPARQQRTVTPPTYETVTRQELDKEGYMEWRSILCETNVTRGVIADVQRALLRNGHNPGPIDGVIGSQTMAAVRSYQRANGLASGQLTMETLQKLGVQLSGAAASQ